MAAEDDEEEEEKARRVHVLVRRKRQMWGRQCALLHRIALTKLVSPRAKRR